MAGTTKAHKHTSPASDGGFLETTETGVTNMSEGSIGYYDSSSVLTELTSGGSGTVLTMGASVPAWQASGGGVTPTVTELVVTDAQTSTSTSMTDMVTTPTSLTISATTALTWATFTMTSENNSTGGRGVGINIDANEGAYVFGQHPANYVASDVNSRATTLNNVVLKLQWSIGSGTITAYNGSSYGYSSCWVTEIE